MHDRHGVAALSRGPRALLLAAALAGVACGAGGSDPGGLAPTSAGAAEARAGAPALELRGQLDLPALLGRVIGAHDEPLEIEGADNAAGIWGYTHADGRRFALTGTSAGLSIVEVTNPRAPRNVGLIPGPANLWREVKTYRDHVYVTTEAVHGLDIISMANPDKPRKVQTWNRTFNRAHTVWIDEARGLAFVNGTRMNGTDTGMRVLDLSANPGNPTEVGFFPGTAPGFYIHDSYTRGNVLYASAISNGWLARLDVTNPAAITEISRFNTGGRFTHNSWLTEDGNFLFTTDERPGRPVEGWSIGNSASPVKVSEYIGQPGTIPHNVMVEKNLLLVAHYTEGVHLVDVSTPSRPRLLAAYDTYTGASTGFNGCWGAYIFPGTNLIVASDMNGGLFVLEYVWR